METIVAVLRPCSNCGDETTNEPKDEVVLCDSCQDEYDNFIDRLIDGDFQPSEVMYEPSF